MRVFERIDIVIENTFIWHGESIGRLGKAGHLGQLAKRFVFVSFLWIVSSSAGAENMFDSVSGDLVVPVIRIDETLAYSASFRLVNPDPPVWALVSAEETTATSRIEASYDSDTATIRIPEITVQDKLYDLSFGITSDCGSSVCLVPELESLQDLGRTGADLFTTAVSDASTFSCASCHAITETDRYASDGIRRPGHPLMNALRRPHFKNGGLDSMLDAVNICLTEWMNTSPWSETDRSWINLQNWLLDLDNGASADPVVIDVVSAPDDLSGGDAVAGRTLFNSSCVVCHGEDGEGTIRAPKVTQRGLLPEYIGRRVRTSGRSDSNAYQNLTGGIMPFWSADRLSDGELADIVAFLVADEVEPPDPGNGGGGTPNPSGCTSTSPKIGQTLTFSRKFHNVSGMATIIDDCTIDLTQFNFDGGGIDVHVYAGSNLQFHRAQGGFSLLGNLLGTRFENATLRITLPNGVSLDDFDSLSIWCVPVGVSFGDGKFM